MSYGVQVDQLETDGGRILVHRVRRGLLRSTVEGHIDLDILEVLTRTRDAESQICPNGVAYFHDWTGVSGYDSAVRAEATRYMLAIPRPYTEVHIVTRSRLVNMGVAAAMLSLQIAGRPFHAHLTVASFDHEFERRRAA